MPATRKRPAPGTSPLPTREQIAKENRTASPDMAQSNFPGFLYPDPNNDPNAANFGPYQNNGQQMSPTDQYMSPAAQQLQLAGRQMNGNQNIVQAQYGMPNDGQWPEGGSQHPGPNWPVQYDQLDRQAEDAEREAKSKRKIIPPFVQKLNRYS